MSPNELQRERNRLIEQLSSYQRTRPFDITVVFDGWQGGWNTEKQERRKGIELIFSKLGEKADDVIKRLVKEKGAGAIIITSDRDISRYAEKMTATVIPSDKFKKRIEVSAIGIEKGIEPDEEIERGLKRKGPARRLSKKEKRIRATLKKL